MTTPQDLKNAEKFAGQFRRKDRKGGTDYFYGRDGFIRLLAEALSSAHQAGVEEGRREKEAELTLDGKIR